MLTGHVAGAVVQTPLAALAVLGVALLLGFRPGGGPLVRGLLAGTPVAAGTLGLALGWAAVIAPVGWVAARRLYERRS